MIRTADSPRIAPKPASTRPQDADWPADGTVRFLVRSPPDARGKQRFYALWWSEGRRRAQLFNADSLARHVRAAMVEGQDVDIVERIGVELRQVAA